MLEGHGADAAMVDRRVRRPDAKPARIDLGDQPQGVTGGQRRLDPAASPGSALDVELAELEPSLAEPVAHLLQRRLAVHGEREWSNRCSPWRSNSSYVFVPPHARYAAPDACPTTASPSSSA